MTLGQFQELVCDKSSPASEAEIAAFEMEIGIRLPEDYRKFLILCHGGTLSEDCSFIEDSDSFSLAPPESIYDLRSIREYRASYRANDSRMPTDVLPIIGDGLGNEFCIGISSNNRGKIYFFDHEGGLDPTEYFCQLSDSFTEFIANLRLDEGS